MPIALTARDVLSAWCGPSLLILDGRGGSAHPLAGYFHRETRVLSGLDLRINGETPWLCEAASPEPRRLQFSYVYPEVTAYGGGGTGQSGDEQPHDGRGLPQRGLLIDIAYRVHPSSLEAIAHVMNVSREPLGCEITWCLGADFADIQEAHGGARQQHAPVRREPHARGATFVYDHPQLRLRSDIDVDASVPWQLASDGLMLAAQLPPRGTVSVRLRVRPGEEGPEPPELVEDGEAERVADEWRDRFTRVDGSLESGFRRALAANVRDLASFPLLDGPRDEWLALQAGVPLYPALFGRDAITAGWQMALLDRGDALRAALTTFGRRQSERVDDWRDEQPGRLPYQMRRGPLARLNINPYAAYYADFATPLMFVIALANLYAWRGDARELQQHWDTARRVLEWADRYGDADGDGYLEYLTRSPAGAKNQGWKDSGDAIVYDDGSPVRAPIATCELQGYWYAAQELMAVLHWMRGERAEAAHWFRRAAALKERFNRDWWLPAEGTCALAFDCDKRPVRAASSNAGHCLASGIIDADHLRPAVDRLFAPDMFSGWGIRTLSASHAYYDPVSYHRGSVWAVEQATIVFGLRRFGFDARALDLATAVFELSQLYPGYRIPECVGGFARSERATPSAYPRANTPQLWNASAFPLIVQSLLGLLPLAPYRVLIIDPVLPEWMPELVLRDLRVGDATTSLRFSRRADGTSTFDVLATHGRLRVIRQPPPESITASWGERLRGVIETITA